MNKVVKSTEKNLAIQVNNFSTSFIESLYLKHWHELCRLLYKLYGSGPPEPEDIAQEAFTKMSQVSDIKSITDPKAFLFKIAFNISLKSIGQIVKTRQFIAQQLCNKNIEPEEINPEKIIANIQHINAIENGMKKLTLIQREILIRSRIKGETYAQISAITGCNQTDICRQLNTALGILETIYAQESNLVVKKFSVNKLDASS